MKMVSNYIWGLFLILVGIILGLNSFGVTNINLFFDGWWTVFIIAPSLNGLIKGEDRTGALIGLIIGVFLLLSCQDVLDFKLFVKLFIPAILIIIGLSIFFKDKVKDVAVKKMGKINAKEIDMEHTYTSTFSEEKINLDNEKLESCAINSIFGSVSLDLRNAIIDEDVVINNYVVFGGVTIKVPKDVNIVVKTTSIFGGVDNKTGRNKTKENVKTIYIKGTILFGGIDIKWMMLKK